MAADGWLGIGWPKEYGGQGRGFDRAVHLLRRVDAGRRPGADAHDQLGGARRSCSTARRSRRTSSSPKILAGEIHFAIGYTEPDAGTDLASLKTQGRARRRRVRDQRPEGLHQPRHRRRLHLARGAHRPGAPTSTRASRSIIVPTDTPGFKAVPHREHGQLQHQRHVLRGRAGAGTTTSSASENQGWNLITNQLNHERVTLCSSGIIERQPRRRAPRRPRTTNLADGRRVIDEPWVQHQPGPGARPPRVPAAHELAGGLAGRAGPRRSTPPRRRRSRCSAPSSTWRASGSCWRSSARSPACATARRRRARAAGIGHTAPRPAHPHLRRRHQRAAARPHRHLRPRHAPARPADRPPTRTPGSRRTHDEQRTRMDFTLTEEQTAIDRAGPQILGDR